MEPPQLSPTMSQYWPVAWVHEVGIHLPASRSVPQTFFVPLPPQVKSGFLQSPHSFHLPQLSPMRPQYCPPNGSQLITHWTSNLLASKLGSRPPVVVVVVVVDPPVAPLPPLPPDPPPPCPLPPLPLPLPVLARPVPVLVDGSELQPWNMDQVTTIKTAGIANRANLMASPFSSS
jgi:hypothetical protein